MITYKAKIPKVLKNIYFTKKQPVSLIHFLTNRCNARCSFCFIDFDNPKTLAKDFKLRGIPTTILFNKDNKEFARIIGSIDFKDKKFIRWIKNFN